MFHTYILFFVINKICLAFIFYLSFALFLYYIKAKFKHYDYTGLILPAYWLNLVVLVFKIINPILTKFFLQNKRK